MALKKKSILLSMAFLIGCFVCACGKEDSIVDESLVKDTEDVSSTEEIADEMGGKLPNRVIRFFAFIRNDDTEPWQAFLLFFFRPGSLPHLG